MRMRGFGMRYVQYGLECRLTKFTRFQRVWHAVLRE